MKKIIGGKWNYNYISSKDGNCINFNQFKIKDENNNLICINPNESYQFDDNGKIYLGKDLLKLINNSNSNIIYNH